MSVAEIQPQQKSVSLLERFGNRYGVDPQKMMQTLKATCFNVRSGEVTNEQLMSLLVVADQYKLNPFTKELFAFPDKGGIVPVVSVDGWSRIINENPNMDGVKLEVSADGSECVCSIYRKDRSHPTTITEYMSEVRRDTQPWKSHPKRMLRHKALIQCARIAFGFAGIYDEDEAERIVEAEAIDPEQARDEARREAVERHATTIKVIKAGIAEGDEDGLYRAAEAWFELTDEEKESIWCAPTRIVNRKREPTPHCPWTTAEREVIKSDKFRLAYYTECTDEPSEGEAQ
jgi:phage recombination protein Bet